MGPHRSTAFYGPGIAWTEDTGYDTMSVVVVHRFRKRIRLRVDKFRSREDVKGYISTDAVQTISEDRNRRNRIRRYRVTRSPCVRRGRAKNTKARLRISRSEFY